MYGKHVHGKSLIDLSGNVFRNIHAEEEYRTWLTADSVIRRVR
jgi:hypothetical protein